MNDTYTFAVFRLEISSPVACRVGESRVFFLLGSLSNDMLGLGKAVAPGASIGCFGGIDTSTLAF